MTYLTNSYWELRANEQFLTWQSDNRRNTHRATLGEQSFVLYGPTLRRSDHWQLFCYVGAVREAHEFLGRYMTQETAKQEAEKHIPDLVKLSLLAERST